MKSSTCMNEIIKDIMKKLNEIILLKNKSNFKYCCGDIEVLNKLKKYNYFEIEI